jgi:antitoxin YokJ
MKIKELIEIIASKKNCVVHTPAGLPKVGNNFNLPEDVIEFYTLCGGVELYNDSDFPYTVLPPNKVKPSTPIIFGAEGMNEFKRDLAGDDPTNNFFTIVEDDNGDYLVLDLDSERLGFCYDAFHENYGSPGDMPVIALDFTELLTRLVENEGKDIYWLDGDFNPYGDAYDNIR